MIAENMYVALFCLIAAVLGVIGFLYNKRQLSQSKTSKKRQKGPGKSAAVSSGTDNAKEQQSRQQQSKGKSGGGKSKLATHVSDKPKFAPKATAFVHPWLASTLKGPASSVLDLDCAANDKLVTSCADDRTVMIWAIQNFKQKENRCVRVNIEFDYATLVKFSFDYKQVFVRKAEANTIECFKITKKDGGQLWGAQKEFEFPKVHEGDITGLSVARTGKFLLSSSSDTKLILWSPKGKDLAVIDTHQAVIYCSVISPCGRFIGSSGFTSDVKIWQVIFAKQGGEFQKVANAFELKGHTAGVESFSFNDDSSRMATISKDGTWKLWDTKVEFERGQEPYLLRSEKYEGSGPAKIALSPDGKVIVLSLGMAIHVLSYEKDKKIPDKIFDVPAPISCLMFDHFGKYFLVSADRQIHVFHNVTGFKVAIRDLRALHLTAANKSMKERIQLQIDEAQSYLAGIDED